MNDGHHVMTARERRQARRDLINDVIESRREPERVSQEQRAEGDAAA